MQNGTLLAAVDLGSNSYRLEIGRHDHGQIQRVEYLKETVRQGAGLDEARNLTPAAMQAGLDCLARFAERLAGFPRRQVRAVATQTLREARNRDEFLARAHRVLGFPIDVVSGGEEARLIYQGVAHLLPQSEERRLVVDIGGRSTELIVGRQYEARATSSFRVGSVSWSMRYFPHGEFTEAAFARAGVAAQAVFEEAAGRYDREHWDLAYGSSGTIGAVGALLEAAGRGPGISRKDLQWLLEQLLAARTASRVRLAALKDDRRPVIGGGLSVLLAVFDLLGIDSLQPAAGALRHGVLYDLLDRDQASGDVRSATVQRMAAAFAVDAVQAQRVGDTAVLLLRQLRAGGGTSAEPERDERKLRWAAMLHEIGCRISHSDYHKHGAYILDNAEAPGFARHELHRLGLLVLGHRGKLRKLDTELGDALFVQQLLCLRLAVILCHARRKPDLQGVSLHAAGPATFVLSLRPDWVRTFPQSAHLLREEAVAWHKTAWSLQLA
ncbi:Ppx/GppA phosphatase family protein [Ramlibacter tataouinensis]|uniref:Ppx/GppA phosphatase family protein n=1 Tax=Ramlibacter tataouinensis TaxID=94132 RepID=UPI0022F3C022|nr:Ppx/GppA phosphatase family protein [Ramlibacter tataouinensis]WBY02236.1 Ppx/GppA phosphatase family protein [Ramlibacter tataouinensis]